MAKVKQLKDGNRGWVTFPKRLRNVDGDYMVRVSEPQTHHDKPKQWDYYVICKEDDLDKAKAHVEAWEKAHPKPVLTEEEVQQEEEWLDEWTNSPADPNAF